MIDSEPPRRSTIGALTNAIISGGATLIAIVALATGIYQAKLSREQANASVWPFLLQGNSGNNGYARIIQNVGIGPAIVRAFEVRVNNYPVKNWKEAADSLHVTLTWRDHKSTTIQAGVVLPANTLTEVLELPDSNDAKIFRAALDPRKFDTWICYCSIYGQCWAGTSRDGEPERTKSCTNDPQRAFRN